MMYKYTENHIIKKQIQHFQIIRNHKYMLKYFLGFMYQICKLEIKLQHSKILFNKINNNAFNEKLRYLQNMTDKKYLLQILKYVIFKI